MTTINKAISYIRANGNAMEQARLQVITDSIIRTDDEIVQLLNHLQNEDGGWVPFWGKDISSLDATCYKLAQFEQLGVQKHPLIDNAIAFILRKQDESGFFEEDLCIADICPPWVKSGELEARLYLTANCALWIQHYAPESDALASAASYLIANRNEEGYLNSYPHTNWMAAGLLYTLGYKEEAARLMQYIDSIIDELSSDNLAWLANTFILCNMDENDRLHQIISRLKLQQQEDGSWSSDDGEWQRTHTTLEALRAIKYTEAGLGSSQTNQSRPQLVLDAGGVIITNLQSTFWSELADASGVMIDRVVASFMKDIRKPLWTGQIGQDAFWHWLKEQCPNVDIETAQSLFFKHMRTLPTVSYLSEWSKYADLHLLSNHCEEWLLPVLQPYLPFFKSITISSKVGYCKPNLAIYEYVHSQLDSQCSILFVDDQEKNFMSAQQLGWDTLLADSDGQWIEAVTNWVQK